MVRHPEQQPDRIARLDYDTGRQLHLAIGVAREHVQRRVEAQAFLDGCGGCLRRREKSAGIAALRQDRPHRVAGLVHGRFMAGIEQKDR